MGAARSVERGWSIEALEADDGTVPYERFIKELSDFKFGAIDAAVERVLIVIDAFAASTSANLTISSASA